MPDQPHIDTLDEAIAEGLATEEDRCENAECEYCCSPEKSNDSPWKDPLSEFRFDPSIAGSLLSPERTMAGLQQRLEGAYATVIARGQEIELLIVERDEYMRHLKVTTGERATWESFFQEAAICVVALEDELQKAKEDGDIAKELVGWWQQRSLVLEAAVKNYAGHIWNDLSRKLKERENARL